MMKYILTTFLLGAFWQLGFSQCQGVSNFAIGITNQFLPQSGPTCQIVDDINHVEENDVFYAFLEETVATDPISIEWFEGAVSLWQYTFPSLSYGNVESYGAPITLTGVGMHTITCVYDFETSCSVTKTYDVEIFARECPYLVWDAILVDPCSYPESSMNLVLNTDPPNYTITSAAWEIYDGLNNNISNYTANSEWFTFYPNLGILYGSGVATVLLANGNTCYSEFCSDTDGFGLIGWFKSSDPYFEVDGNLYDDVNIDIIFKGTNIVPLPAANHRYTLLVDGVIVSGANEIALAYNQVIATLPTLSIGSHTIKLIGKYIDRTCPDEYEIHIDIIDAPIIDTECISCNTFKPIIGERYWISAWVKEDQAAQVKTYTNAYVELDFIGGALTIPFTTTGNIVEGWQRIVGSFTVPIGTTDLDIKLKNSSGTIDAFFDDIRINPFNSSMKSYVYDPVTLLLSAELDDNNYATFYEYDKEMQLIRIKKETAKGIMTIQESRSSNPKND